MEHYIAYYRVSTQKQEQSGLGLKAQRQQVARFLARNDAEVIDEFEEVESGTNGNRPKLKVAIQKCKDEGAMLLIAKLDRLSRNVAFLFNLKEELEGAGVGFVFADMPDIGNNTMALANLAAFAEHEAKRISERTKEGIRQSDTYKSGDWGNPRDFSKAERKKAHQTVQQNARENRAWRVAFEFIRWRREQENMSYSAIAEALNTEGYRTRQGKKFHPAQVRKVYLRFKEQEDDEE